MDLDLSVIDDISDTDSDDSTQSNDVSMDEDLGIADPEFFGEVNALPRHRSHSFGKSTIMVSTEIIKLS